MRILTVLTYYRPHTSGLTIYAERLAKALAQRGHQVTVLTTQYEKQLAREETLDGVRVIRLPVMARVNKGVLAPSFGWVSTKLVMEHDAVLLHLPQFDAAGVALRGRLFKKPTAILYHSDLLLPPGLFNRFVNLVVHVMNYLAGFFAHKVVAYTEDFASHSPYLTYFKKKRKVITPNVYLPPADQADIQVFREAHKPEGWRAIGMATRFASEKGVEVLLDALPTVLSKYPNTKVLFAGQYQDVWGEEVYFERLAPRIRQYEQSGHWEFLGVQTLEQMAAYFPNLDVLVVSSLNSTETFGFVQIEGMMNGVPAVASDLPGVRQPVKMTGMGRVIPIGVAAALGEAICDIFTSPEKYQGDPDKVREMFHPDTNAEAFERMFEEMFEK